VRRVIMAVPVIIKGSTIRRRAMEWGEIRLN
jgi:hypothetical protein